MQVSYQCTGKARKEEYCSCMHHLMLKGLETQTPLQGKRQNFTSVLTLWCILQTFKDKVNDENFNDNLVHAQRINIT